MSLKICAYQGRLGPVLLLAAVAVLLQACATQPPPAETGPPGFWLGLLHGFLILFSLIGSLFSEHRIYAFPNAGWWYDFGFLLGASAFLGGGGAGTCKSRG